MVRCGTLVVLAALLAWPAGSQAAFVSGSIVFDGGETLPSTVQLSFPGGDDPDRTVAITGTRTAYGFALVGGAPESVRAAFTDPVAPDAFWLRRAPEVRIHAVAGRRPLLGATPEPGYVADAVLFRRGVRLALPITDRTGRSFRPPAGWRSRGGSAAPVFGDEDSTPLPRSPRAATALVDPDHPDVDLDVSLAYADRFGVRRTIRTSLSTRLPTSAAGTTVRGPAVRIDATPPTVRTQRLGRRDYALFVAQDVQTGVSLSSSAGYVRIGGRWRLLPRGALTAVAKHAPDGRYVTTRQIGIRLRALRGGRHTVRLCVANQEGVMAAFARCATATVR